MRKRPPVTQMEVRSQFCGLWLCMPLWRAEWYRCILYMHAACFGKALIMCFLSLFNSLHESIMCSLERVPIAITHKWPLSEEDKGKLEMLWLGYWVLWKLTGRKYVSAGTLGRWLRGVALEKGKIWLDVVPHAYNPNTSKEKAGGSASSTGDIQGEKSPNKETETKRKRKQRPTTELMCF